MIAGLAAGALLGVLTPSPAPAPQDIAPAPTAVYRFVPSEGHTVLRAADAERLMARLFPALQAQMDVPIAFGPVHCAADVIADGRKQTCTATVDGTPLRLRITAFDTGEGTGPIQVHTDQVLLDLRKVERVGLPIIQSSDASIDAIACPGPRLRPADTDEMFACTSHSTDGKTVRVLVHAADESGQVNFALIP